jgi:excisionase family DNA binding protein
MRSELLTPAELAEVLKVSRWTLSAWLREGKIPARVNIGKVVRYDLGDVQAALAADAAAKAKRAAKQAGGRRKLSEGMVPVF